MQQALSSRTELPVHETDRWFRILAESTSTAIFVYRADQVLYVNPACEALTGFSSEELLAMLPWQIATPDLQPLFRERVAARLRGDPAVPNRFEARILTKDGRERGSAAPGPPSAGGEGEPVALQTAIDITERKWSEERRCAIVEG